MSELYTKQMKQFVEVLQGLSEGKRNASLAVGDWENFGLTERAAIVDAGWEVDEITNHLCTIERMENQMYELEVDMDELHYEITMPLAKDILRIIKEDGLKDDQIIIEVISGCARCHGTHNQLVFSKLAHPIEGAGHTHWASCPTNAEPILLVVEPLTIEERA